MRRLSVVIRVALTGLAILFAVGAGCGHKDFPSRTGGTTSTHVLICFYGLCLSGPRGALPAFLVT
jgi:hypothetical protein